MYMKPLNLFPKRVMRLCHACERLLRYLDSAKSRLGARTVILDLGSRCIIADMFSSRSSAYLLVTHGSCVARKLLFVVNLMLL